MAVFHLTLNGTMTGINLNKAETFFSRFIGLMGKKRASPGLLITRCVSIHTFFMRTSIDAVFTGEGGRVVKIIHSLGPWKAVLPVRGASAVFEIEPGAASGLGIKLNDILAAARVDR